MWAVARLDGKGNRRPRGKHGERVEWYVVQDTKQGIVLDRQTGKLLSLSTNLRCIVKPDGGPTARLPIGCVGAYEETVS
jgi:hypothetical protein